MFISFLFLLQEVFTFIFSLCQISTSLLCTGRDGKGRRYEGHYQRRGRWLSSSFGSEDGVGEFLHYKSRNREKRKKKKKIDKQKSRKKVIILSTQLQCLEWCFPCIHQVYQTNLSRHMQGKGWLETEQIIVYIYNLIPKKKNVQKLNRVTYPKKNFKE